MTALIGFANVREKENELKRTFHCLSVMSIDPSIDIILQTSTVKMCESETQTTYQNFTIIQWLTSLGSWFYLYSFGFLQEKKKLRCKGYFYEIKYFFLNSQWWECSKMSSKPSSQILRWSNGEWVRNRHFFETGLVICGEKRKFWKEEWGKRDWEKEKTSSV